MRAGIGSAFTVRLRPAIVDIARARSSAAINTLFPYGALNDRCSRAQIDAVMTKYVVLSLLLTAACGGKSTPANPPGGGSAAQDTPPPAGMAFKDMNGDQRVAFMKLTVMPAMKATFQEFDAKEFATFECKTCHGSGAADGSFEMPNADIDKLPPAEKFAEFAKESDHARWIEFMATKVKPQMAKLLMETEFDPTTNTGEFGCHACHMVEGEEAKKK
jgi:hypothetical protein